MHYRHGLMPVRRLGGGFIRTANHDKKRVTVPAIAGSPHALAKETGCPKGITARRTPRALAERCPQSKEALSK